MVSARLFHRIYLLGFCYPQVSLVRRVSWNLPCSVQVWKCSCRTELPRPWSASLRRRETEKLRTARKVNKNFNKTIYALTAKYLHEFSIFNTKYNTNRRYNIYTTISWGFYHKINIIAPINKDIHRFSMQHNPLAITQHKQMTILTIKLTLTVMTAVTWVEKSHRIQGQHTFNGNILCFAE